MALDEHHARLHAWPAAANAAGREAVGCDRPVEPAGQDHARRLQALGSLASGIAHNVNNILSAILGYSEMVEPHLARGTKAAQHVGEIRQAAERGRDLVDAILAFGRRSPPCPRPVRIGALLDETTSLLHASLPAGIGFLVGAVPPALAVSGEPAQLQQVLLNLCANAAQAMEGRGCIRLAAERRHVPTPMRTSHGELTPGRYVGLCVADRGHGFGDGIARRLFEPFFTTRPGGTGLGLATVRDIVHGHGGAMHVLSRPGQGSRFEAWLPAAEATDEETMPAPPADDVQP